MYADGRERTRNCKSKFIASNIGHADGTVVAAPTVAAAEFAPRRPTPRSGAGERAGGWTSPGSSHPCGVANRDLGDGRIGRRSSGGETVSSHGSSSVGT